MTDQLIQYRILHFRCMRCPSSVCNSATDPASQLLLYRCAFCHATNFSDMRIVAELITNAPIEYTEVVIQ